MGNRVDTDLEAMIAFREHLIRFNRTLADIHSLAEVDALADEFHDRFGALPAEAPTYSTSYASSFWPRRLAWPALPAMVDRSPRAPPLPEGITSRDLSGLPDLASLGVRKGKNALWMPMKEGWEHKLAVALERLIS